MSSKGKITIQQNKRNRDSAKAKSASETTQKVSESDSNSSESNNSGIESENDDNLADLSSDEANISKESDEEEQQESEGDDFPRKKKPKMNKHSDGSIDFSSAVGAILGSHLKAYDRKDPIMARNKKVLQQNEADKLEWKARKAIVAEKKKMLSKSRKKDIIPIASDENQTGEEVRKLLEKEAKLRKVAQKGAVKLFNAILSTQVKTDKEVSTSLGDIRNAKERKQLITEISKEKFLDLVKAAGEED
ncbi:hypothetical protein TBLA_0C05300 [Henningerozyma blattae CBS 6284]|uniref:Ribosomal RNA-processing protein 15 n=1 Tax=Henningerozyma blattae (strain ATCC 34711 / CBS 6284 / DSM 70876 / NBRC 10599 / NRRL Y-10934 / UCD 77-7) TaxID=1071380 RepID=I2H1S4_HENB6|nr:hypothetical protein TBLA_0C05300 [Tetrapisispora blattae CBS 6284]CCH60326.1 hypothetical protein TBLA_0C05300 [Tetrapisispora blattae CBS 6284]